MPRARKGTSPGAADFRERVADALARYADELPIELEAPAQALYDEWVALSLALARGVLSGAESTRRFDTAAAAAGGAVLRWEDVLERGRRLRLDGTEGPFAGLERHRASPEVVGLLLTWLTELGERARGGGDALVRELGGLYEIFLGLSFERLAEPARRLRKSRTWLSPAGVLAWPASVRSKRLQRELGLSKHSVHAFGESLARAQTVAAVEQCLASLFDPRVAPREAGRCVLWPSGARRTSGAHYTPWSLCLELCERVLAPLVRALPEPRSESLLELRVCDPAMGAGAFSMATTCYLADALLEAWRDEGRAPAGPDPVAAARRAVATRVVRGVDKDPIAVCLARCSLELLLGADTPLPELGRHLRAGDALVGALEPGVAAVPRAGALDWRAAFPDVFQRPDPGFDAVIGNPPWVAYVGRAAQPLEPELAGFYALTNPSFKRYRTLHGLFVYRSALLLRGGGRLGLVLPTSVADLEGYAPTRHAHDTLCSVDTELPDWGDGAFDGVVQPCMALLSTRRAARCAPAPSVWPLRNDDLGPDERRLLERLSRLPRLPREAFGERGFQTTEDDLAHLRRAPAGCSPHVVALREGADVSEFRGLPPQLFADPAQLEGRLRPPADWQAVKVLIRQTARFPLAAFSDGQGFRNSILAGFETPGCSAALLLGLLNSQLLRWLHYAQHRDARQGMPQLKVSHLRALPAPPPEAACACAAIERLAERLGAGNAGIDTAGRAALDAAVGDAFGLDADERELVARWAALHPPPASRRRPPGEKAPWPADLSAQGA